MFGTSQTRLARDLAKLVKERGLAVVAEHVESSLASGQLTPRDFSIRDLAEELISDGREFVRELCNPRVDSSRLAEAAGAVSLASFARINLLMLSASVMQGYQQEEFVGTRLVDSMPSELEVERMPGVTNLGDKTLEVKESDRYPEAGVSEDFIDMAVTKKYGLIVPVTREAIFFDRTGLVQRRAFEVGQSLGIAKEKRILDAIIGVTNNYNWRGTGYDTYQASTPWINVLASNELVDWTDLDASEQIFAGIVDPNTGEPVVINPTQILVMPYKKATASRILQSTSVRFGDGASSTVATYGQAPIGQGYGYYVSKLAYARIVAAGAGGGGATAENGKNWWFHGDFKRAFVYRENWPITITQAPPNATAEFERDVVLQVKASERGAIQVMDPRFVVKNYLA